MAIILKPDRIYTISTGGEARTINEKIIPDGAVASKNVASWIPKGSLMKPNKKLGLDNSGKSEGITIHNTEVISTPATTNPAEQYTRATYPNGNMGGVVVHFYVYKSEIWQNLKLDEQGWHAADGATRRSAQRAGKTLGGNLDTIAIEVIGNDSETEKTAAILTAWLCNQHGFDSNLDVYTHKYFSGKNCPVWLIPKWGKFLSAVKGFMGGSVPTPTPAPSPPSPQPAPVPTHSSMKTIDELANEVMLGAWGNDPERSRRLTSAGYDSKAVQARVNEILRSGKATVAPPNTVDYAVEVSRVAAEIWAKGNWGDGDTRVRNRVNETDPNRRK